MGGSWNDHPPFNLVSAGARTLMDPNNDWLEVGFRCASEPKATPNS